MAFMKAPSEEAVIALEGLGLPREEAIRWLRSAVEAYDSDSEKAANAWIDNPNAILDQQSQVNLDESWNEGHFHTDKTGSAQQTQTQHGVRPSDTLTPNVFNDAAPSRPPSRVSTKVIGADAELADNMEIESEDDQVNKAVALSMSDSQNFADHRSRNHDNQTFGPANRNHYDVGQWAMTIAPTQTQEILLNPEPNDRKRQEDAPAFFKPSPSGHRLPALLKILHAIPMAREALLHRDLLLPDYGFDKNWWDGTPIKHLRIVNLDLEGRQVNDNDILHETQRLMAFLDETTRAYGSVEVVTEAERMKAHNDKVVGFFLEWRNAASSSVPDAPLIHIFDSKGTKRSINDPNMVQSEPFHCLTARVDDEISGKGLTLYDAIDHILWTDNREGEETFLERVGDVFAIEVSNLVANGTGLGITIPATWYADRYLPSSTKEVKDMLYRKSKVKSELESREKMLANTTHFQARSGTKVDGFELIQRATAYLENTAKYRDAFTSPALDKESLPSVEDQASCENLAKKLWTLSNQIDQKVTAFEEVQDRARAELREISQMYTQPSKETEEPPIHRYTLRGVSTTSHTAYVLEKTRPEDCSDMLGTEAQDWQWWRTAYLLDDAKPVVYAKVTEEEVLQAAATESTNALLVYASEAAISYNSDDLPTQLRNFVRADNLEFSNELDGSSQTKPATPTKRRMEDDDSDDLEVQHHRSPPHDRVLIDTESPSVGDENPPEYSLPHPPPATSYTNARKSVAVGSYDEVIPTALKVSTIDPSYVDMNDAGRDEGQEMQERGGRQSLLHQQTKSSERYTLGNHASDIIMDHDEVRR